MGTANEHNAILNKVAAEATYDWEKERRAVAQRLLDELGDLDRFRDERIADIQRARQREQLPSIDSEAIRAALMSRPT